MMVYMLLFQFYLEETRSFPNSENQHVDPASFVDVRINSITLLAKPCVRYLNFMDRACLFSDERPGWNGVYKECFSHIFLINLICLLLG